MATRKSNPKTTTRTGKVDKKKKVAPVVKTKSRAKKKASLFSLSGQVRFSKGVPAIGLKVILFDKDVAGEDRLGLAITDADGTYRISFADEQFRRSVNESRGPDLLVRVYDAQDQLLAQSKTVRNAPADLRLDVTLPERWFVVRGTVKSNNGKPMAEARVRAFDRDLRKEQSLGEPAVTDGEGRYEVRYPAGLFVAAEAIPKVAPDLIIRVYNTDGKQLAESGPRFNATPEEIIDLVVIDPFEVIAEFERYVAAVLPLLKAQGADESDLSIAELNKEDIQFLTSDTGIDAHHLHALIAAFQVGRKFKFKDREAACYAWFRKGIEEDAALIRKQPPSLLRAKLKEAIAEGMVPTRLAKSMEKIIDGVGNADWNSAKQVIARLDLPDATMARVIERIDTMDAVTDVTLRELQASGVLNEAQADRLGLAASLHQAALGSIYAVAFGLRHPFDSLGQRPACRAADLAKLDHFEWLTLLQAADVQAPQGISIEQFAAGLEETAIGAYPTIGMLRRTLRAPQDLANLLEQLAPDTEALSMLWKLPLTDAKIAAILPELTATQHVAFQEARRIALRYPGLPTNNLTLGNLEESVNAFTAALAEVAQLNSGKDLLALDYSQDSVDLNDLRFGSQSEEMRVHIVRQLRATRRVLAVAGHPTEAAILMGAGYHSAAGIALDTKAKLMAKTGVSGQGADRIRERALTAGMQATHAWMAVRDAAGDQKLLKGKAGQGLHGEGAVKIARWSELFGIQDSCDCAHCLSVLSPAAYFVDLMHYIEEHILSSFAGTADRMHLYARRSDLWELPLTCENTSRFVATLDIVNAILEEWISQKAPALNSLVNIYTAIAAGNATYPNFQLPAHFPLERLEILLAHFGLSRDHIIQAAGQEGKVRTRARLKLWPQEYDLIATPRNSNQYFEILFGLTINVPSNPDQLITDFVNLSTFQEATALDRDVLRELVGSNVVSIDGSGHASVKIDLVMASGGVQNSMEQVKNLTSRRLDRLHRVIRLWRKLPWTVGELDYVLARMAIRGLPPGGTVPATGVVVDLSSAGVQALLSAIVQILDISDWSKATLEETMALWDVIPDKGFKGQPALFDRRFNPEAFVMRHGRWPGLTPATIRLPSQTVAPADSTDTMARLLSGLGLTENDLAALLGPDGLGPLLAPTGTTLALTASTLAILYRHARLGRLLKVSPAALCRLIRMTPELRPVTGGRTTADQYVQHRSDLFALIRLAAWQKSSGYSLEDIEWLLNPTAIPEGVLPADAIAAKIVQRISDEKLVVFPATLFTTVKLTEEQSRTVTAGLESSGVIIRQNVADRYRLPALVTNTSLAAAITAATVGLDFKVLETAVMGLAQRLGEFEATAFTVLFVDATLSTRLVADNLETTLPGAIPKPFVQVAGSATPAKYRLNSAYLEAAAPAPFVGATVFVQAMARGLLRDILSRPGPLTVKDTLFSAIGLSEQQSQWLVAQNTGDSANHTFSFATGGPGLVINAAYLNSAAFTFALAHPLNLIRQAMLDGLRQFDPLVVLDRIVAGALGMDPAVTTALRLFTLPQAPVDAGEVYGEIAGLPTVTRLVRALQRWQRLFKSMGIDTVAALYILDQWNSFDGQPNGGIDLSTLKAVSAYGYWLVYKEPIDAASLAITEDDRRSALNQLIGNNVWSHFPAIEWSQVLRCTRAEIVSLNSVYGLNSGKWYARFEKHRVLLEIAKRLGVSSEFIALLGLSKAGASGPKEETVEDLWQAADAIYGAFRAKYPDEKIYQEKSEAFEDKIRGKRRDALVAYAKANAVVLGIPNGMSLYDYFLMDVKMGGCARTSKLVAAISSLQLYVHRVLMGLEPAGFDDEDARRQWYWRKNYRVWEANRKVFLFPENFIEPDLRDDKTPLFRDLEDALLQRRITHAEAQESYTKYLTGYAEVAGLKIVGAFQDVDSDVLHLVGVTADEPPVHYLRRIINIQKSQDPKTATTYPLRFTPWEKLGTQIPSKWVSPVVYQRKLMLFWNEIATVSTTRRIDGQSYFDGYEHKFKVKWVEQRANGTWSTPQELHFLDPDGRRKAKFADWLVMNIALFDAPNHLFPAPLGIFPYYDYLKEIDKDGSAPTSGLFQRPFKAEPRSVRIEQNGQNSFALPCSYEAYAAVWHHGAPLEEFSLSGWRWNCPYPTVRRHPSGIEELQVAAMNSDVHGFLDLPKTEVPFVAYASMTSNASSLRAAYLIANLCIEGQELYVDGRTRSQRVGHPIFEATVRSYQPTNTYAIAALTSIDDRLVVNQRAEVYLDTESAQTIISPNLIVRVGTPGGGSAEGLVAFGPSKYFFMKLTTSIQETLLKQLRSYQLAGLLDAGFQQQLIEKPLGITSSSANFELPPKYEQFSYTGPYGTYFRELFFHIPFLVANHLNSQQRFEESQRWYDYIFNPLAPDGEPWRFREFVTLTAQTVRAMLTDPAALAVYRNDPFNPHAIARLRLSAYQKSIVMKYVDNLLDWGDRLFSEFTMESVDEATMLYVLAADILGTKPNKLPKCAEEKSRSYSDIKPFLNAISDLLIEEMEEIAIVSFDDTQRRKINFEHPAQKSNMHNAALLKYGSSVGSPITQAGLPRNSAPPLAGNAVYWSNSTGLPLATLYTGGETPTPTGVSTVGIDSARLIGGNIDFVRDFGGPVSTRFGNEIDIGGPEVGSIGGGITIRPLDIKYTLHDAPPPHFHDHFDTVPPPPVNVVEYVAAKNIFCFPVNQELLAYYDRVEDRLFKIRHCMDIAGVRRNLALFAPEINPRLLVRMKAAGLSLEDVLENAAGHVPPYRFAFLLEKARQYAGTVQNLGSQLLAALEKQDGEELAAMRTVHERNLLEMRTKLALWEIDVANDSLEGLQRQKASSVYRQAHFAELIQKGLSGWELTQSASVNTGLGLSSLSAVHDIAAAIAGFIPQVHSPTITAVTAETGGNTVSGILARISSSFKTLANIADRVGALAGLQASFERRTEEWNHQKEIASREIAQLDKQIAGAEIRVSMAERSIEVHQQSIEQAQELYEFYRDKFTNLGLYTWMSTQLHRLYRLAFDSAWSVARMAEQALHFERPELRDTVTLSPMPWSNEKAGLLAGEALILDLQRLELNHLQTNTRLLEVEQSFSLAQFYPGKLIELRQTGECSFDLPEFFFDLHYPGHYFRRIKAVRMTLPCVVGPYTSIGATLRMTRSQVRERPMADQPLTEMSLRYAPTICASTAQSDAGVFEFSFRDERLLPFEGTGAISSWILTLPKAMPSFDYATISDVILRISYTAHADGGLRDAVQAANGALADNLRVAAPQVALSLRNHFPTVWARFKQSTPTNGWYPLQVELNATDYPFWLRERLAAQENVTLHALYEDTVTALSARIGTRQQRMDVIPIPSNPNAGTWFCADFPSAKPATDLTIGKPTLQIYFQSKEMSDVIVVISPQ